MDGIGIQILDGIENKTLHYPDGRTKRRQRRSMLANFTPSQREEFFKQTRGITARIADDTDTVINGLDFAGFSGSGSIDDDEMAYNYLLRTKNIVDNSPQVIAGYTNPGLFSQMLGYVIENWDTANREGAIIRMANEENKLIEKGELQPEEGEYEYLSADESINIDDFIVAKSGMVKKKASKNGFFNNLKKTTTASITGDIAEVVASNPLLYKRKNRIRKATQSSRTNKNKLVATAGIAKTISQHTSDTNSVNGLLGNIDEDYESDYIAVERGYDVAGLFGSFTNEEEDLHGLKEYLIRTRKLVSSHPDEFFSSPKEAEINIAGLDHIIINFDDKNLREKAIQDVSSNKSLLGNVEDVNMPISDFASALGSIFKKIGRAVKKTATTVAAKVKSTAQAVAKGVKTAATTVAAKAKSTAQAVAKVATKLWTGIKKVAKKVWKAIVKYNPLTIAARAGVLLAANLNLFHLGSKLFVGYTTEDEAKKLGYSSEQWKKAVAASAKASKLYTNIGGNLDKLKTASRNGAKREWKGIEKPPASTGEFISRSQSTIDSRPDLTHSAVSEYNADKAKIQASGAQIDNTLDPYKGIVTTQVETTLEVIVDKNGKELTAAEIEQAKKEGSLKGLFGIDATTAITVHGLINNGHIGNSNLGIDPVTVTIITASVGLITSILKVLADSGVGGKTMQTIAKVATVADAAAQGANDINQSVAIKKLQQTQATATPTPTLVAKEEVKKTTQTPASTTSKSSASEFTDFVNNATKKVETVLNTKKKVETDLNTAKKVVANALDILSPNSSSTQKQPVTPASDITIKNPVTTTNAGFNIDKLLPWGVGLLALASIPIIYSMNSNKTENNG